MYGTDSFVKYRLELCISNLQVCLPFCNFFKTGLGEVCLFVRCISRRVVGKKDKKNFFYVRTQMRFFSISLKQ